MALGSHITMRVESIRYDLFVHWFLESDNRYEMTCRASGILNSELARVEDLTKIRSLQAWATSERLQGIEKCLGPEGTMKSKPLVRLRGSRRLGLLTGGLRRPVTRS